MIAILTISTQTFNNYRIQHGIDERHAKQIAKRSDLIKCDFTEIIDLDPLQNVTEAVRKRIGDAW